MAHMKTSPELNWKKQYTLQESAVSTTLQGWLLHSGSFMQRLREHGVENTRIHVLSQEWQCAEPWECELLQLDLQTKVLVREVMILNEQHCWMFARSVFPRQTLTGEEAELADLKTRPLGTVLFNHPEMKRSEFSFVCLQPGMQWHQKVMNQVNEFVSETNNAYSHLWSRHSVFHLYEKSLLLTEVFLPDMAAL